MLKKKILGALYGAAYGDSLGALTESCTRKEILHAFPKGCTDYQPSISRITKEIAPGQVTDDFGSSCYVMKTILRHGGKWNKETAIEAILDWAKDPVVFGKYAGQNTKKALENLNQGIVIDEDAHARHFSGKNTNGGAMKACPVGLLANGNFENAIEFALNLCWPTHYNSIAASGAGAIACAVSEACKEDAALDDIIDAAVKGAVITRIRLEEEGYEALGPYVEERIKLAVELGRKSKDFMFDLISTIGTGIHVQESVPAVFGIMAASHGNLPKALQYSVNCGGDTDTISSMLGAVLGAYHGIDCIEDTVIERIQVQNQFLKLKEIIDQYTELVAGRKGEKL